MSRDLNKKERIIPVYIEEEMKNSYLSYSMSVIVGRALPDVRDGLKACASAHPLCHEGT